MTVEELIEKFGPEDIIPVMQITPPNPLPDNQPFLVKADITTLEIDCIVNAANNSLLGGGGVDGAIHHAAGPCLLEECRRLRGCKTGEAKITNGYDLPSTLVIHTVGPVYDERRAEECEQQLKNCYFNSLELAQKHGVHSIAFPAISTGIFCYPALEAAVVAVNVVREWFQTNPEYGLQVIFCCYDQEMLDIYMRAIELTEP